MKPTITCKNCGTKISIDEALLHELKEEARKEMGKDHQRALKDLEERTAKELEAKAAERVKEAEAKALERASDRFEEQLRILKQESAEDKKEKRELYERLKQSAQDMREANKARDEAELRMEKKLAEVETKAREEAQKAADEKQRLNLAAKDKTITDLQKALDEAQRKAAQGSQQLQGEIMELDLEEALKNAFRDDDIMPVAKGVRGGDILQMVKSPRGTSCGALLWEIKRTKNWADGWIPKLKEDVRNAKANIPIIISEIMPRQITEDMGQLQGVWICKPQLAIVLSALLRKSLLDAGMQRALAENRGGKAEALFNFVTSHEFIQQIESMIETYQEMHGQVAKERVVYEKLWSQREKQAQKLLLGTANIIGSMQGHIGQASMPKIKGLELLEAGEEEKGATIAK